MAKVWVLDTGTKGTGASVVPLESTLAKPEPPSTSLPVPPKPRARRKPKPPAPRTAPRFKVVDVVSGEVRAEGADGRTTLGVLREVRSVVDVRVYVWRSTTESWRLLTLDEQRSLWRLRDRPERGRG